MSKKRRKNRTERIICPICFDDNPNDRIELIVKRVTFKATNHPLILRNGKIEIDYGFMLAEDIKQQSFILMCPKCKIEQKYKNPDDLIKELEPLVEYIAQFGAFNERKVWPKPTVKKDIPPLPKIIKISTNDTQHVN